MAQKKSQLPLIAGLTAAAGVGYYLYNAGGSPKAAEKQFEDMSQASGRAKAALPGRTAEAQRQGEAAGREAGAKVDDAADKSRSELAKAESKIEQVRKEVGAEAMKSVDAFDRKVEEGAAKAKSGIWGWFGGK